MATGKEAFESACQIGVAKTYNYRQLSQIFHGIDQAFNNLEVSGIGNIVVSGSVPDGEENGQIGFFQGSDGNYYEYIWVDSEWKNVKTQNEDVTVAGSAPFITISGTAIETQRDINHYLNEKIESLILDPSGEPIDLELFATISYVDAADNQLEAQIEAIEVQVSGYDFSTFATTDYVNSGDTALGVQIAEISGNVDDVEVAQADLSNQVTGINVRVVSGETTQQQIIGRLDQLETTRGADKLYQVLAVTTDLAVRNGELVFNNADATLVSFISLAPFDNNGNPSPLVNVGDIIDVELGGATNRYQVAQGTTDAQSILCIYLSGNSTFAIGQTITIYIYPQNSANYATTDYVDAQTALKLNLTGGALTGTVTTDSLIKSTRTGGYAFQVYNESSDSNVAFLHSNGNIRGAQGVFTDTLEVRQAATFKKNIILEAAINATGNVNSNGGWVTGNWGFDTNEKGVRWYTSDRGSNHLADITWQTDKLETLIYDDYLWTLKVQNSGNTDSKVLISADYSSGLILNEVGELNTNGNVSIGGNLSFSNGGTINVSNGNTVLSGRASLDIKTAADYPVVISSGSSYKKVFAIYGYEGSEDDNRGEVAYINANGKAYFNEVYANDEKLATESFVNAGGGMRWQHATHTTAANLVAGEFFIASNGNIYLHPTSYDGVNLAPSSTATEVTGMKQLGSVHRANGESAYHITWDGIRYNNESNRYIRIQKNAIHLGDSTTQGEIYRLNIPGFTF